MNEQDARARMVADITARVNADDTHLVNIVQIYKLLGFDLIQIDGEDLDYPVGAKFRRDWSAGVTTRVMASDLNLSAVTVSKWAHNAGLPKRHNWNAQTIKPTEAFRRAWMAGIPAAKMAEALNVSPSTISATARRSGLPKRRRGGVPRDQLFTGAAE